ncbi:MAG: GFA family protein [Pseudomonadota bacterium]
MTARRRGKCLCDAVQFTFRPDSSDVWVCHCNQCRRWSGHLWASVNVALDSLTIDDNGGQLDWFRATPGVRRGFCKRCGSALFWHADGHPGERGRIAVAAGTIDRDADLKVTQHIFTGNKGLYYDIGDGVEQRIAE